MTDVVITVGFIMILIGILGVFSSPDHPVVGVFLVGGVILFGFGLAADDTEKRKSFMEACAKDRKEYECTAMWRAGERGTTVVPVPVVIPR